MALITLLGFCFTLIGCIILDLSIIYALIIGFLIFCTYGILQGNSLISLIKMAVSGIKTVKNILIIFVLIGILTALWRSSGTIPVIICWSMKLIHPSIFVLVVFILNCIISLLTGTAFGTAATMGVISMTIAETMGVDRTITGGAVLSGIYFGDRCSPVSTSALLVAELTKTNIFSNIKKMLQTGMVPFILTSIIYFAAGYFSSHSAVIMNVEEVFEKSFKLHWITILPAVVILLLSVFKINVKITMSVSIVIALLICIFYQNIEIKEIVKMIFIGYSSENVVVAKMLNGGGIISMAKVTVIVCLSSSYAGLFKGLNLLTPLKKGIEKLSHRISPFGSILCTSILTSMIACNQTLTIILTHQICEDIDIDRENLAIGLENSAVVIAPLIPWSIAGAVPIATIGASTSCLTGACFLYLLPIYTFIIKLKNNHH